MICERIGNDCFGRNEQILRFAQDDNEAERVILSEAKDLYISLAKDLEW